MQAYQHQIETKEFVLNKKRALVFSDPGTGKTASLLMAIQEHRRKNKGGRALVVAPKAILEPAWVNDCRTFTPSLSIAAAHAKNRKQAFEFGTDIVVTNHDAVKTLLDNPGWLDGFDFLVMDESTAFKHHTSQRGKAMASLRGLFDYRVAMSGTPMPNGLLDIWNQVFIVDDGEHLGSKYYAFRAATHEPVPVTRDISNWVEKDGARDAIADLLADITIRYALEDCIDMPEHVVTTRRFDLSPKLMKHYKTMLESALLELDTGEISAVHAAALTTKLVQIASGSVYGDDGAHLLDVTRYDLIAELCAERPHTLVAFMWHHQREQLIKALERIGISQFAVIDSNAKDVPDIVKRFQEGKYRVLLAHPQSASHGLTLTRATTTIWSSPTYDAERFRQFNRRIYRSGQKQKSETILIQANDTIDEHIYARVQGKMDAEDSLLDLVKALRSTMRSAA